MHFIRTLTISAIALVGLMGISSAAAIQDVDNAVAARDSSCGRHFPHGCEGGDCEIPDYVYNDLDQWLCDHPDTEIPDDFKFHKIIPEDHVQEAVGHIIYGIHDHLGDWDQVHNNVKRTAETEADAEADADAEAFADKRYMTPTVCYQNDGTSTRICNDLCHDIYCHESLDTFHFGWWGIGYCVGLPFRGNARCWCLC